MPYQTYRLVPDLPLKSNRKVLLIYTGGTLGMVYDTKRKHLVPFDFNEMLEKVPEMRRLDFEVTLTTLATPIDSSNVQPSVWVEIVEIIERFYDFYDGFVVVHGTDTMAYTASAVSFMLQHLRKPVIFTGAQLPVGAARTDAKENLITALEIAAEYRNDLPVVSEVCIYFSSYLLRGNRAKKKESYQFYAFRSENYPPLAEVGVSIEYNFPYLHPADPAAELVVERSFDDNVLVLKLFPGISERVIRNTLRLEGIKGVVLETYGAGNAPTYPWFLDCLKEAIQQGIILFNVSQCDGGRVTQGHYQTSSWLQRIGVVSGADITTEAAITKMMFAFGQTSDVEAVRNFLAQPICGEMTA